MPIGLGSQTLLDARELNLSLLVSPAPQNWVTYFLEISYLCTVARLTNIGMTLEQDTKRNWGRILEHLGFGRWDVCIIGYYIEFGQIPDV
jgi:hypothetical protein